MEIFLSALLKKILPDPCFQKAFWVMNLGMKFITVAEKRDGENFIFAFDLGGAAFGSLAFSPRQSLHQNSLV